LPGEGTGRSANIDKKNIHVEGGKKPHPETDCLVSSLPAGKSHLKVKKREKREEEERSLLPPSKLPKRIRKKEKGGKSTISAPYCGERLKRVRGRL